MSGKLVPSGSQTVGPFFRIGLDYLAGCAPAGEASAKETVTIRGRVLDRDGGPVPDAMLEFWSANAGGDKHDGFPDNFRRVVTDSDGSFCAAMARPADPGGMQAPHLLVLVFARGLLRHLISGVYFAGERANDGDPVLLAIPAERRHTLIAQPDGDGGFHWDVILQGNDETVFFAW
jgi:protocatechuate 3,4-dioxygenase alpha subunit